MNLYPYKRRVGGQKSFRYAEGGPQKVLGMTSGQLEV